jgi:hypothetical protein
MNKQNVVIAVPNGASDACIRLGVGLDDLCTIGLRVVVQATSENRTTVATVDNTFFGAVVATKLDLQEIARELHNQTPDRPDGPPTI